MFLVPGTGMQKRKWLRFDGVSLRHWWALICMTWQWHDSYLTVDMTVTWQLFDSYCDGCSATIDCYDMTADMTVIWQFDMTVTWQLFDSCVMVAVQPSLLWHDSWHDSYLTVLTWQWHDSYLTVLWWLQCNHSLLWHDSWHDSYLTGDMTVIWQLLRHWCDGCLCATKIWWRLICNWLCIYTGVFWQEGASSHFCFPSFHLSFHYGCLCLWWDYALIVRGLI
jgi:hypothetical protein